jgi:hypothetical protein
MWWIVDFLLRLRDKTPKYVCRRLSPRWIIVARDPNQMGLIGKWVFQALCSVCVIRMEREESSLRFCCGILHYSDCCLHYLYPLSLQPGCCRGMLCIPRKITPRWHQPHCSFKVVWCSQQSRISNIYSSSNIHVPDEVICLLESVATSRFVSLLNQRLFFTIHLDSIYIHVASYTALSVTHEHKAEWHGNNNEAEGVFRGTSMAHLGNMPALG